MKTGGDRARGVSRYWLDNVAARYYVMDQGDIAVFHPECAEQSRLAIHDPEPQLDEARMYAGRVCDICTEPIDYTNPRPTLYHLDEPA